MITAIVNSKICYPLDSSEITVKFENPYIKSGDSRTLEIAFPLDIPENAAVFGAVNRLDTHFQSGTFPDCALLSDNIEVIRGTGTITSVTRDEVKLQILSGRGSSRYEESWSGIFIDEIDYGTIGSQHEFLRKVRGPLASVLRDSEYQSQGFIGIPGKYAYLPVYDETNDICWNAVAHVYTSVDEYRGLSLSEYCSIMPNLMHVLTRVIERLGFTVAENVYNTSPWDRLYVCSAKRNVANMAAALPHWSVATFLEEFRKTFNAIFLFDYTTRTVRIRNFSQTGSLDKVAYEPTDDFSTSFEEEGVEYLGSSNLEYELSSCERLPDCISQEMVNEFGVEEFDSYSALYNAFTQMTTRQKLTKLFKCPNGFYYGYVTMDGDVISEITLEHCGENTPLIRKEGGSTVSLKMVPVAVARREVYSVAGYHTDGADSVTGEWVKRLFTFNRYLFEGITPVMAGEALDTESSELDTEYTIVYDVFNRGESIPSHEEEDVQMQLVFASGIRQEHACTKDPDHSTGIYFFSIEFNSTTVPVAFTDRWQDPTIALPAWSMSLNVFTDRTCIGSLHNGGYRIVQQVNGSNEICIEFLCDGKPDPQKIFVFGNRLYLCSHIEAKIRNGKLDAVKKGYFYEIL